MGVGKFEQLRKLSFDAKENMVSANLFRMNENEATDVTKAMAALEEAKNEPLQWLLGKALRETTTRPNFLLTRLSLPRSGPLIALNAWIDEFRQLLTNPTDAPGKAARDLRYNDKTKRDFEGKLGGIIAEVQSVIKLSKQGFSEFTVIIPPEGKSAKTSDFEAMFEGRRARIEVKNLQRPQDDVQAIATSAWSEQKEKHPKRFAFNAVLRHRSGGSITPEAAERLRTIIAQFPCKKGPVIETLDGGVEISLERLESSGAPDAWLHSRILKDAGVGRIVISSSFGTQDLQLNLAEMQALFLKAMSTIGQAQSKFFGRQNRDTGVLNVLAVRWENPGLFYSSEALEWLGNRIEQFYAELELQMKVVLFCEDGSLLPWDKIDRFK